MTAKELERRKRLDEICNEFEDAWAATARPEILSYLNRVEADSFLELLHSLLEVDVELRIKAGQNVTPDDYSSIHPTAADIVDHCLRTYGIRNDTTGIVPGCQDFGADFESVVTTELKTVGSYQLTEKIGEGGMGTVWRALQVEPIRRTVAMKFIKTGLNSRQVIARFESERQALSVMSHPNIAAILDGGTAASGQPYFVMELVQGLPLTTWCDQHRLEIDQRLRLFIDVCHGLQHAHQKGIIHRDLKPSNLLVTEVDGRAVPKIIDFGLAKALENTPQRSEESQASSIGQILGTLKYMSPEQAGLQTTDVDTRSDVYSLGAILFELLTGSAPLDSELIRGHSMLDVLQVIRERDPVKPSSRLSSIRKSSSTVTDNRQTDFGSLNRILVGDLDWIVMKALDREQSRRYQTASEFADDLKRYLNSEAVMARPPSTAYRIRKFVSRNRAGVAASGILAIVMIGGIIGTSWGWLRALESDRESRQQFINAVKSRVEESMAKDQAQKRLAQIEKGNAILEGIFADLDIGAVKSGNESLETVLSKRLVAAAEKLEGESIGDPIVVARMQDSLGQSLFNLGFPQEAASLFGLSLTTLEESLGPDDLNSLTTKANLASAMLAVGDIKQAIKLFEEVYPILQARVGDDNAEVTSIVANLAKAYHATVDFELAFDLYEQVFLHRKALLGERDPATLKALNGLAGMYYSKGQILKSLSLFEEVVRLRTEVLGEDHKDTLNAINNLASVYQAIGDYERATPLFEKNIRRSIAELGADHPNTLNGISNLANAYITTSRFNDAIRLLEDNMELAKKKLGDEHPLMLTLTNHLARGYTAVDDFARAVPLFQSTLEIRRSKLGKEHVNTLITMACLAGAYSRMGDRANSIPLLEEVLQLREASLGRTNAKTILTIGMLGVEYIDDDRLDEGILLLEEVADSVVSDDELFRVYSAKRRGYIKGNRTDDLEQAAALHLAESRKRFTAESPEKLAQMLESIGSDYLEIGNVDTAVVMLREAVQLLTGVSPEDWRKFRSQFRLGAAQIAMGEFDDAESNLRAGYAGLEKSQTAMPRSVQARMVRDMERVVELYELAGKKVDAQHWREQPSLKAERSNPDPDQSQY